MQHNGKGSFKSGQNTSDPTGNQSSHEYNLKSLSFRVSYYVVLNRLGIKSREFVSKSMLAAENNGAQIVADRRQLIPNYVQQTFLHKIECFSQHLNFTAYLSTLLVPQNIQRRMVG